MAFNDGFGPGSQFAPVGTPHYNVGPIMEANGVGLPQRAVAHKDLDLSNFKHATPEAMRAMGMDGTPAMQAQQLGAKPAGIKPT